VYASAPGRLAKQSFGRPDGNLPCIPLQGAPEIEEASVMNGANHGNEMQVPHQHGFLLPAQRSERKDEFSQMVLGPDGGARVQALNSAGTRDEFQSPPGLPEVYASAPGRLAMQSFKRPDGNSPCIPLKGAPETEEAPVDMKWPSFQQPQAPVIQQSQPVAQPLMIQPFVMQPPVMQIPFIQQPFIGNDVQPFGERIQQGGDVQLGEQDGVNSGPKEIFIPKQGDDALSKFLNKFCR